MVRIYLQNLRRVFTKKGVGLMNTKMRFMNVPWIVLAFFILGTILMGCAGDSEKIDRAQHIETASPESKDRSGESSASVSDSPLADTEWRLVEIQSMDDAVGTTRPDDPSKYTMKLNRDGTVNMVLNCNRAFGNWIIKPGRETSSGNFEFGPLASTRVLCPPPSLDERITADSGFVRSYLLKDGRLYLSLMADAGIYVWEPNTESPYLTVPDPQLEEAILDAEPYYTREVVEIQGATGTARYVYGRVDLNEDGREEVFVYLLGSIFCGTGGCNLMLFTQDPDGYSLINNLPISRLPVIVSEDRNNGWNDLFKLESGGGAPSSYVRHTFDGNRYVERERLPADKAPAGKQYLTGELVFEKGIPLEPRN
jgi:heat shock protein HslJ